MAVIFLLIVFLLIYTSLDYFSQLFRRHRARALYKEYADKKNAQERLAVAEYNSRREKGTPARKVVYVNLLTPMAATRKLSVARTCRAFIVAHDKGMFKELFDDERWLAYEDRLKPSDRAKVKKAVDTCTTRSLVEGIRY